jgi:hypothetical protein
MPQWQPIVNSDDGPGRERRNRVKWVPTWATVAGAGSGLTQQQVMAITTMRI